MGKIGIIAGREWRERVRKRSFVITTILTPILLLGITLLACWLVEHKPDSAKQITVIDQSGVVAPNLQSHSNIIYKQSEEQNIDELKYHHSEEDWGILLIGSNILNDGSDVQLYSFSPLTIDVEHIISHDIKRVVENEKLKGYNIENLDEILANVESKIQIGSFVIDDYGVETSTSSIVAYILAYLFGFVMYILVLKYGAQVMYGVIEEKSNRVLEVMVSSVKPFELMLGKIIGVAYVALTQIAIWIVVIGVLGGAIMNGLMPREVWDSAELVSASNMLMMGDVANSSQAIGMIMNPIYSLGLAACFVLFFVGGYLLYAAMFAAVGSACDDAHSSNQLEALVTMPIIAGLIVMFIAMSDPEGSIALWGSLIPFTSPIVMIARIPYGVPMWEIVLSLALLYATFVVVVQLAGRIYKTGILTYGKRVGFGELYKWIKYKN